MKNKLPTFLAYIVLILIIILVLFPIFAHAKDITKSSNILINNSTNAKLTDGNENSYITINKGTSIKITNDVDIYGVYIIYEMKGVTGRISNYTREIEIGTEGYLHEYLDIEKLIGHSKELELIYNDTVKIGEIYVLSNGELPDDIEVWNNPCKEADLMLLSTHSDDEQLFFAGLMPTYVARGACVQVVYFTNHNDNPKRLHEQIHGLYKVGIRNYPIIGFIPDAYSTNLNGAMTNMNKAGYKEDDAIKFEVEMIRRFKPQVVVGHDELGEYSHGQHILNTYILEKAILLTNDETYDIASKDKYGLWDTPKTYLHLYKDNKIVLDYDTPLEYFNGKTAYEVSKEGYKEHHSQQYTWFTKWLTGVNSKGEGTPYKKASEIKAVKSPISGVVSTFSPCEYGLYRTLVGEDVNKNDMFENLTIRKDQVKEDDKKDNIIETIKENITTEENKITLKIYTLYIFGFITLIAFLLSTIVIVKK